MDRKIGNSKAPRLKGCLESFIKSEEEKELATPYTFNYIDGGDPNLMFDKDGFPILDYDDDDFDDYNDDDFDANLYLAHCHDDKLIYFYMDIEEKEALTFYNMSEFAEWCSGYGYFMSNETMATLIYNNEIHCCIDNTVAPKGCHGIIVAALSYSDLLFNVCDSED